MPNIAFEQSAFAFSAKFLANVTKNQRAFVSMVSFPQSAIFIVALTNTHTIYDIIVLIIVVRRIVHIKTNLK